MTELTPLEVRPENLTDRVFQSIRDSIVDKTLVPGSRVSEANVAAQLKVSKTPVREALLRLKHLGLVESVGERGLRIVRPSIRAIRNAFEVRAAVERASAFHAANRASSAQRETIIGLAQSSLHEAKAGNGAAFRAIDGQFHRQIAAAADNAVLAKAVDESLILCAALRERDDPRKSSDSMACATEHVATAKAILVGDAEAAGNHNAEHVLHVMSLVLDARADLG